MQRVLAIADHLQTEGKYSDGVTECEKIYPAGHYVHRLADGSSTPPFMAGNDEQYAAMMALLANLIGVPARVVLGALVPEGGVVTGAGRRRRGSSSRSADGTWRTLPTEEFMDDDQPADLPPQTQQLTAVVPPPAPIPPPSTVGEQTDAELQARKNKSTPKRPPTRRPAGVAVAGPRRPSTSRAPLLVLVILLSSVVGAKLLRRRRRRTRPGGLRGVRRRLARARRPRP